jgi:putative sterol carrier protein
MAARCSRPRAALQLDARTLDGGAKGAAMPDATAEFFEGLSKRGSEPMLGRTKATVRFDIADGGKTEHWLLGIDEGKLDVSHGTGDADCVISADKAAFDRVASGSTNAMASLLRGAIVVDGDPRLIVRVQRLFPAPTGMPETAGDRSVGKRRG